MAHSHSTTVLSSKGQIVIPKAIRDALGLREGQELEVGIEGHRIVLQSISKKHPDWRSLRGAFGPADQTTAQMLAEGRAEEARKESDS